MCCDVLRRVWLVASVRKCLAFARRLLATAGVGSVCCLSESTGRGKHGRAPVTLCSVLFGSAQGSATSEETDCIMCWSASACVHLCVCISWVWFGSSQPTVRCWGAEKKFAACEHFIGSGKSSSPIWDWKEKIRWRTYNSSRAISAFRCITIVMLRADIHQSFRIFANIFV